MLKIFMLVMDIVQSHSEADQVYNAYFSNVVA